MPPVSGSEEVGSRQRTLEAQRQRAAAAQAEQPAARTVAEQAHTHDHATEPAGRRAVRQAAVGQERETASRRGPTAEPSGRRTTRGLSDPAPSTARTTSLRVGARGPEVEALQRSLNERGAQLEVDGKFGPRTQAAVRGYQAANPPLAQDGIVGSRTRASLARPAAETNKIREGTGTAPTGPVDATNPRNMTVQQAAQYLLNSPNVQYMNLSTGGTDRQNIARLARGEQALANATGRRVDVNPNMMRALVAMAKEGTVRINALTGGVHSHGSTHYAGNAVDLSLRHGNTARILEIARQYGGVRNSERTHMHIRF